MKSNSQIKLQFQINRGIYLKYSLIGLALLALNACGANHQARRSPVPSESIASKTLGEGIQSCLNGDYAKSSVLFKDAADRFQQEKNPSGQCESLIRLAHVFLSRGQTKKAFKTLDTAENIAEKLDSQKMLARIYALRGNLYNITGDVENSLKNFEKSMALCEQNQYPELLISVTNDLGNLYASANQSDKALETYMKSAEHALKENRHERSAIALANAGKICIKNGDKRLFIGPVSTKKDVIDTSIATSSDKCSETKKTTENLRGSIHYMKKKNMDESMAIRLYKKAGFLLDQSWIYLKNTDSPNTINTAINIGTGYIDLAKRKIESTGAYIKKAHQVLSFAESHSEQIKNTRLASYIKGYLGAVYQLEGNFGKAAELTFQAIFLSKKSAAPEAQYRWEWQYANILKVLNRIEEAVSAYENAIDTLESVRSEFSNCYGRPQSEMRELASGLYKMYVDVLLRYISMLPSAGEKQILLKTAREAIEKNRLFELRQYFNDDCLGTSTESLAYIDHVLQKAIVIYPIILPNRLAVVASFPPKAEQENSSRSAISKLYVQDLDSKAFNQTVEGFRAMLEKKIMPPDLTNAKKLYDWLIGPLEKDLADAEPETLVFVPGGMLRGIPMGALHDGYSFLIESYATAVTPGLTLTNPTKISPEKINILAAGISSGSNEFVALPGVSREIEEIASLYSTKVLMNDSFSLTNFENELRSGNYNVVHIASHGKFSDHIEDSFILTADDRLTFNKLSDCVGLYRFRENPLELITLSACETASGNEQAALGLAGLSIKIGARSAFATLWAVEDEAAAQLVPEFYRQLKTQNTSRAMALKQAKLKLLNNPVYGHPGYWAPFILINNWL